MRAGISRVIGGLFVQDPGAGLWATIGAGSTLGAAATALARIYQFGSITYAGDVVRHWELWLVDGVVAGAIVGGTCWILWRPATRLTRGMIAAVGINWFAWTAFLMVTPPLPETEFETVAQARAMRDAGGGLDLISDQPTIMAARSFGGFRSMPFTERFLFLMAGPAALTAQQYVVPPRYATTQPTRRESYVLAAIAFVLSTAFWLTFSGAVGSFRRRRRAAAAARGWASPENSRPAS